MYYILLIQFLGEGIFNADGAQWSESRALLRPQFLKQKVSDLDIFERHISKMLSMLPRDGQTIDLMDWWFRMTLDAGTEYLFGKSVDSLDNPKVVSLICINDRPTLLRHFRKYKKSNPCELELGHFGASTRLPHSRLQSKSLTILLSRLLKVQLSASTTPVALQIHCHNSPKTKR